MFKKELDLSGSASRFDRNVAENLFRAQPDVFCDSSALKG